MRRSRTCTTEKSACTASLSSVVSHLRGNNTAASIVGHRRRKDSSVAVHWPLRRPLSTLQWCRMRKRLHVAVLTSAAQPG